MKIIPVIFSGDSSTHLWLSPRKRLDIVNNLIQKVINHLKKGIKHVNK